MEMDATSEERGVKEGIRANGSNNGTIFGDVHGNKSI